MSVNPGLDKSTKRGLGMYDRGVVKEGVGSGGALISLVLKSDRSIDRSTFLNNIEKEYERNIEKLNV
jgi:NaMN:DMB phosphoribosyltransferase